MRIDTLIAEKEYLVWLALGDSITEYNHCTEGYPNCLQHFDNSLKSRFGKDRFVIVNAAVGGRSLTDDLGFAMDKIDRFKPEFVTVMYGMNDTNNGEQGLAAFKDRLKSLCNYAREKGVVMLLLTQNPLDFGCDIPPLRTRRTFPLYEKAIVAVAAEQNIEVIDIYSIWKKEVLDVDPNEHFKLLHDVVHPNHKGHEYIYSIMKKALME